MTPQDFYNNTMGKAFEVDGAPATDPIQCADYFKHACIELLGYSWPTGGDGYVDYFWYNRMNNSPEQFEFITDPAKYKNGDFVIWPHKKRNANTPFPFSHVAMFWQKSNGIKYMVGQNQPYKWVTEKPESDDVWNRSLGAFRFKNWTESASELWYGLSVHEFNGIKITAVRAPKKKGYDLHMITANGENCVKKITDFDSEKLTILAGVNANYYQMNNNRHLGCEGDGTVQGYQQIVPSQRGWLAFFQKEGNTFCWDSTDYYYDQKDVDFVCSPYAVRLFHGNTVFKRSTNCDDKDDIKNTQTACLKFENGDWAVAIFSDCYPRNVYEWAIRFKGIQDVILMDSGGSTQMFECTSGTRKVVRDTNRYLTGVMVLAKKNDPSNVEKPTEEKEKTETELLKEQIKMLEENLKKEKEYKQKLKEMIAEMDKYLNEVGD